MNNTPSIEPVLRGETGRTGPRRTRAIVSTGSERMEDPPEISCMAGRGRRVDPRRGMDRDGETVGRWVGDVCSVGQVRARMEFGTMQVGSKKEQPSDRKGTCLPIETKRCAVRLRYRIRMRSTTCGTLRTHVPGGAMRACFASTRTSASTRGSVRAKAASEAKPETTIRRHPPSGAAKQPCGVMEFRVEVEGNEPKNILEEIVWYKDVELADRKQRLPLINLMQMVKVAAPTRDFVGALHEKRESTGLPGLIAEVKKASPSKGIIRENFNPVEIAMAYEEGGAACLSVLTDEKFFQGGFENLKLIRNAGVKCPLLCKEFIVDAYQVFLARAMGADAILLIAAVLPNQDLAYLTKAAKKLGMVALVEVHTADEMERVLKLEELDLLGINNRNLEDFTVDLQRTVELLTGPLGDQVRERGITVVGESGIFTPDDIKVLQDVGVGAILVGESIVKQGDITTGVQNLLRKV